MTTTLSTRSSAEQKRSLDVFEVKPGVHFDVATLRDLLPDVETVLFFGKVYNLNAQQLGTLLHKVRNSDLTKALFGQGGEHSQDLQDYVLDGYEDEGGYWHEGIVVQAALEGTLEFTAKEPKGEILPEVWNSLKVEVAGSIQAVAEKLEKTISMLPGKQGSMVFRSMMKMNARRPVIGDYRAAIHHERQVQNLVIFDVSGSMSESTVRTVVEDVVALSYNANAHLAIVSNNCFYWEPGSYSVDAVLDAAEYSGTHYEMLADLLNRDWGTVVTIADYDSSASAKDYLKNHCTGHIDTVLDISLVPRPTFLGECVGQLASDLKPILIAEGDLTGNTWSSW